MNARKYYVFLTIILILVSACTPSPADTSNTSVSNNPVTASLMPTEMPEPTVTPTPPPPTTIHLSSDGSGDFVDLETAVAAAAEGATIYLDEGNFHLAETLNIEKSLSIIGEGKDKTIISGSGVPVVARYTGSDILTLRDISLLREGEYAASVLVVIDGKVDFSNCRFANGAHNEDKTISGVGLIFFGSSSGKITGCEIDNNSETGVVVMEKTKIDFIGNDIHDNGGSGIYYKLDEDGGSVKQNDLQKNGYAGSFGGGNGNDIYVSGSYAPTLTGNTCSLERPRFSNPESGNSSGIQFLSRKGRAGLPQSNLVKNNNCAINWCSTESGSLLVDFSCRSHR